VRFDNLRIINLPKEATEALANMSQRTMQLNISMQDGEVSFSDNQQNVDLTPETLYPL